MPLEILCVALGSLLALVHVLAAAGPRALAAPDWAAGPRDAAAPNVSERAKRVDRARGNLLETFPIFAAVAIGVVVGGASSGWTEGAAVVWLVARALYLPAYVFHVPFVRSAIWFVALAAIGVLISAIVFAGGAAPAP